LYKRNTDKVKELVGDRRKVCGVWRCQICENGVVYYEVDAEGAITGRCNNPDCAEWRAPE